MPEIRPAQPHDYPAVVALWEQYDPAATYPEVEYLAELPTCTVALQDREVVGFCIGHHASGAWMECRVHPAPPMEWDCSSLETIVVEERSRGVGIGTALLADFADRARAAGTSWLLLHPKHGDGRPVLNPQMLRFYARAGFRLLEPAEDGLRQRPWLMGRPLAPTPRHVLALSTAAASRAA
ncbi:GNAT family N-acetyltransferase [Kocuria oceani]|uniref:GNAT family N-acetyltransferase n=1 Tax=Kocuria oceani TaxID=988827 RepID=UPI0040369ADF